MSHHTGARLFTLADQRTALTPVVTHSTAIMAIKAVIEMFHDPVRIEVEKRGMHTSTKERKFATGTRGYVGSI